MDSPVYTSRQLELRDSMANQTDFALALSKQVLLTWAKDSNLVFSPVSIHVVLSLITAGSAGPTRDQLLSFLKAKSTDHLHYFASQIVAIVFTDGSPAGGPKLSFANSVWIDKSLTFKPSFQQVVDASYKAATNLADFETKAVEVTREVNTWAEKETRGLIKEVLPADSVDPSTRLIVANALYFKGAWNDQFDSSRTKDNDFFLLNGNSVQVPFMTSDNKQIVRAYDGFKVLGLPYKQGEDQRHFSMYLFLPNGKDGLPALVEKVGSESGFLNRHLPYNKVTVGEFRIPRFKISSGFEASEDLKKMGLVLPFSSEGGLTEMVNFLNPLVSHVFHKSFIDVSEKGTEPLPNNLDFVADHPFLFLVREDLSGTVLFVGQVFNPLAG
ncbi:hypothetical protein ACJRO7_022317 [Eucalyptus globulus]|uniref:Serpin domain-containing protein n=1 Tax=Eucalyptus globulus TaxID=34317 RepID=A0ABD3JYN4_EUCGL